MFKKTVFIASILAGLTGCGQQVEVRSAQVGKVMTKDGYSEGLVQTSKFRLAPCWSWCDKLVVLDVSDQTKQEKLTIFMPADKLNVDVTVQVTLSVDPRKTEALFASVSPKEVSKSLAEIEWQKVYRTYAQQEVLIYTRQFLSQYTIGDVASNLERVNAELSAGLQNVIKERTPFTVRNVGLTDVKYPAIITDAQENAAKRREQIQQEEAQLAISKVQLERELQEARLNRQIEVEKAETEAAAQKLISATIDPDVLELRRIDVQQQWINKWNGTLPTMVTGDSGVMLMVQQPK